MSKLNKLLYAIVLVGVPASYFLNFGWFRLVFAIVCIPYYFVYAVSNYYFIKLRAEKSLFDRAIFLISGTSYLGANILMLDGGDSGASYICFGMIELDNQPQNTMPIFAALLAIHILAAALQTFQMIRFRKQSNK